MVNHKKILLIQKTKKHNQLIECLWGVEKSTIIKRSRESNQNSLDGKLAEFWFRSLYTKNSILIFEKKKD